MTYIGMVIDKNVSDKHDVDILEVINRGKAFASWPGMKVSKNLICIVR